MGYVFASNGTPRNNQKQNEQFKSAMKKLGFDKSDWQWRKAHDYISKKGYGYQELLRVIKEYLRRLMG